MGFASQDDWINKVSNLGQTTGAVPWNKITGAAAYTAGRWYDTSLLSGSPNVNLWAGTALAWRSCDGATGNGTQIFGLQVGGNVSPATKHLANANALTSAGTGVPGSLQLVDLQGYWPGVNLNVSTTQTLTGTPSLRYTNGAGVRPYLVCTVASGATAQNVAISYTNQAGTTGRSLGATVAMTASAIAGHIAHSGTASNNFGWALPLFGADSGVQNVASLTLSAASGAGTAALCLARPIGLPIPIGQVNVPGEREYFSQIPSLPEIKDSACLVWLYSAGAATAASSNFSGTLEAHWG